MEDRLASMFDVLGLMRAFAVHDFHDWIKDR